MIFVYLAHLPLCYVKVALWQGLQQWLFNGK